MNTEQKNKILIDKIKLLEEENRNLREELAKYPSQEELIRNFELAKEQYDLLNEELKKSIQEYNNLYEDLCLIKANYKKQMVNEIIKIKKAKKKK